MRTIEEWWWWKILVQLTKKSLKVKQVTKVCSEAPACIIVLAKVVVKSSKNILKFLTRRLCIWLRQIRNMFWLHIWIWICNYSYDLILCLPKLTNKSKPVSAKSDFAIKIQFCIILQLWGASFEHRSCQIWYRNITITVLCSGLEKYAKNTNIEIQETLHGAFYCM